MVHAIPLHDWLRHLDAEYVSTFIKEGGASIKFAVMEDGRKPQFSEAVETRCRALDYAVVKLDAVETKVHMPQDVFFGLAKQVDWRFLARRMIVRLARGTGYDVDAINPGETTNVFEAIGKRNGLDSQSVLRELRRELETMVSKEYRMDKDFRVAMTSLCLCENVRQDQEYGGQPLIDWLTGRIRG